VIADSTVGNGELPSIKIVVPCQQAATRYLNYRS
jgi:hypothetical protein